MGHADNEPRMANAGNAANKTANRPRGSRIGRWIRRLRPRRLLQFRLTTLLWLVLVISILLAWRRDHQLLVERLERRQADWGIDEVIGEPNTPGYGDIPTAWASATQDDQKEWLILRYRKAVIPKSVLVYETCNPGAVYQVSAFDRIGVEHVLWKGTDPTPAVPARGISNIPIPARFKTNRIKVYIDSPKVPGWNEIDAVGLVDASGKTQWATDATGSSSYAARYSGTGGGLSLP